MPQIGKGGKYVFGWSEIGPGGRVRIPPEAFTEYSMAQAGRIIVFSGSKQTGGICVSSHALLRGSGLGCVLTDQPELESCRQREGAFMKYKGRFYAWLNIGPDGVFALSRDIMKKQGLSPGGRLLAIRGSNLAFVMGARGILIEAAERYEGEIPLYRPETAGTASGGKPHPDGLCQQDSQIGAEQAYEHAGHSVGCGEEKLAASKQGERLKGKG